MIEKNGHIGKEPCSAAAEKRKQQFQSHVALNRTAEIAEQPDKYNGIQSCSEHQSKQIYHEIVTVGEVSACEKGNRFAELRGTPRQHGGLVGVNVVILHHLVNAFEMGVFDMKNSLVGNRFDHGEPAGIKSYHRYFDFAEQCAENDYQKRSEKRGVAESFFHITP
jgi:hypothetical protein